MQRFVDLFRHVLNPMHVYCRLVPVFGPDQAWQFVRRYYQPLYFL